MLDRRLILPCIVVAALTLGGCAARAGPSTEASPDALRGEDAMAGQVIPARSVPHSSGERAVAVATARSATVPQGLYLPLERGMTLYKISKRYGVPVDSLMTANGITDPTSIPAGARIFVPGATRPDLPWKSVASAHARFDWPLRGRITSGFGSTKRRAHHTGIDIDGDAGDPILAAADGRVERIENDPRYGRLVIVDHDGGYSTWYAHASDVLVAEGDMIERGQTIALVGSSGDARGTHLHFEVRLKDRPVNPLPFLEPGRISRRTSAR